MLPNEKTFNGKPFVEIEGRIYYRSYALKESGKYKINITVNSINSPYSQAIAFKFSSNPQFKGKLIINNQTFDALKSKTQNFAIPVDTCQKKELIMELSITEGFFLISSASDYLKDYYEKIKEIYKQNSIAKEIKESYTSGFTAAHLYGNAFWMEELSENRYFVHCNDHIMDEDFDDMIFELRIEKLV